MSDLNSGTSSSYLAVGVLAGLAAAFLFGATLTGSVLAFLLIFMMPLPLFLAGLGWGPVSALVGGVVGAIALAIIGDIRIGIAFAVQIAITPVVLSHLALISRPTSEGSAQKIEWYPEGRLVLWTATLSTALIAVLVFFAGVNEAVLKEWAKEFFAALSKSREAGATPAETAALEQLKTLLEAFAPHILTFSAVIWTSLFLVVLALAAKLLTASGKNIRTWAPFYELDFPRTSVFGLAAAAFASLLSDKLGLIGSAAFAAMATAYTVLGLATIHGLLVNKLSRTSILFGVYGILFLFPMAIAIVFALGIAEQAFNLRARFSNPPTGPGSAGT